MPYPTVMTAAIMRAQAAWAGRLKSGERRMRQEYRLKNGWIGNYHGKGKQLEWAVEQPIR